MDTTNSERIRKYHGGRIERWGVSDPRSVGYSDEASQFARFEIIADLYDGCGLLLDVGCGTGRLLEYLRSRYGSFDYVGIDQQPEFIQYAKEKYRDERQCSFVARDFSECVLPLNDVVVASGALSYRSDDVSYHKHCIKRLFSTSKKSLIFNMLDTTRMFPGEVIVGHDLATVTAYCKTLTQSVSLVRGYLPFDFTLMLSKPNWYRASNREPALVTRWT